MEKDIEKDVSVLSGLFSYIITDLKVRMPAAATTFSSYMYFNSTYVLGSCQCKLTDEMTPSGSDVNDHFLLRQCISNRSAPISGKFMLFHTTDSRLSSASYEAR